MTDTRSDTPPRLVIASASPRRRRLAQWLETPIEVTSVDTPEVMTGERAADPPALAAHLAGEKALAARGAGERGLIAAFDTIVDLDGRLLGKPADLAEAREMLRDLSGREHLVHTGIALLCPGGDAPRTFAVSTRVRMRGLSEADIDAWAAAGELLGCAGAYNIESHLAEVEADECFQNVAGLPLCHLFRALAGGEMPGAPTGLVAPNVRCDLARGTHCLLGPVLTGRRD